MPKQKLDPEFKNLLRVAIVVRMKKPFMDWLKYHDPEMTEADFDEDLVEGHVYLIPDFETREETISWMKRNYDEFFTQELFNWYVDDSMWPQNRSYKTFNEWLDVSIHTMIFDAVQGPIEKI